MTYQVEYNNNLEDNDTLLNDIGYYILHGYNNTIVYSTRYNNSGDTSNSNGSNSGGNGANNLNTIIFPTTSKEFSVFGIHKTFNISDDSKPLNHSSITSDMKSESIKLLKSLLCSLETTRSYYTISFTIIRETSELIEKSQILFFQVSSKDLETITEIHQTKKVEVPLIVEDLNKLFYLVHYYTTSLSSISNLNNLISNSSACGINHSSVYYYISGANNSGGGSSPIIFSLNSNNLDNKLIDIIGSTGSSSSGSNSMKIINIELLLKITNNNNNNSQPLVSPMISLNLNNSTNNDHNSQSNIILSNICLISKNDTIKGSIELINKSISYQINNSIINSSPNFNYKSIHFQFSFLPFPISALYKISNSSGSVGKIDDNENYALRKQYHQAIGLPLNRPFLKYSLSISLEQSLNNNSSSSSSSSSSKKLKQQHHQHLKDVHLNLSLESKTGGGVFLVDGSYDYYHYLQDNVDDNGWGCAYRSMQTICSWLKYQNFTNKPIPTHYEIQKILVELKDKDPSFLKSKQWIGAFEITLCLDYLFGIKCKILNITSGSEVIYKSRELAKHFQLNGSPIMIGGGVLAYTLLGIDFNESTGESRYLILDPHYTGPTDNIKIIKEKGWCAWKTSDLFRKDAFYNFCQPQIPNDL